MNRRAIIAIAAICLIACAAGFGLKAQQDAKKEYTKNLFAMDTVMTLTAYGPHAEEAVEEAAAEIHRLDAMLSTGKADSEISVLNREKRASVSEDTAYLIDRALQIHQTTEGLFDPTIYPVMRLWGFTDQNYRVPENKVLAQTLANVDASRIFLERGSDADAVSIGENQEIDLGGIAKGYTSARVIDIFRKNGVTSGMVSLGGNVQTIGSKTDGTDWRIGVRDPWTAEQGGISGVVSVSDKAVITSGGYERFFEEAGKTYIHIIDPRDGQPAEQGLASVTIISPDGTLADALSTSLYIMGEEKAIEYWKKYGDTFDMVLITDEDTVIVSEGIAEKYETTKQLSVVSR